MPRETMSERKSNPAYYEKIECSSEDCNSTEDLLKHRYSEEYLCAFCANKLVETIQAKKEKEHEEIYGREIYYTDIES